ncbi:N-terminal protein methyltransferase ASCRUDRAFT_12609 [Ascoidea rubescens DSM 1968]|uniref:Alpha N-terminal protein methyltransferase 1 n=1 Tax=Ascoidea rubescens DSM 1968 TaxID=1344418 RepID=A0A1D2VLV9_9ASCO|nr:hypothetical protein ASCRUDRAFT_12609 [Ascoidea rubescens DSM 1968]ODV62600.1 hypothetical protein ASCRUDRAFT_12609 [Ascoidea rubescens DSM 1968]
MPAKQIEKQIEEEITGDNNTPVKPDSLINYEDAIEYWANVPATVDGVLGGFGEKTCVPKVDIIGSRIFLKKVGSRMETSEVKYGIEIGAGIGRVTKNLLSKVCDYCDLLEPITSFVKQLKIENEELIKNGKVDEIFCIGMQDFSKIKVKNEKKYWIIWCQWCLGHLPDDELVKFLKYCKTRLIISDNSGTIIVKENNIQGIDDSFDDLDSSVTRSDKSFKKIFKKAGLKLIAEERQRGLPRELYPVKMYALKPN